MKTVKFEEVTHKDLQGTAISEKCILSIEGKNLSVIVALWKKKGT